MEKTSYPSPEVFLKKGELMGQFLLGSTIVMLMPKGFTNWNESLQSESKVQMGEKLGLMLGKNDEIADQ